MVNNKTGGLLRLAVRLLHAESVETRDLIPLANLVGVLFQIRDDYMNLASANYTKEKGFCEDLTEGKFSFPVIHSILQTTTEFGGSRLKGTFPFGRYIEFQVY